MLLFFLFQIWDFTLLLVLLGLFFNKFGWLSQEIQYLLVFQCPGRSWNWSGHWWLHAMPSKLGNALTLFIIVRKWVGLVFSSNLLHNFTWVKVKEVCLTGWILHLKKGCPSQSKTLLWNWHYYSNKLTA